MIEDVLSPVVGGTLSFEWLYRSFLEVVDWITYFFGWAISPLRTWVELDIPGDGALIGLIEDVVNSLIDAFLGAYGDVSLIEFVFYAGLPTLIILYVVRLFKFT